MSGASTGPDFVAIGKVVKPRGILGQAFFIPLSDFDERYDDLGEVRCELENGSVEMLRVDWIRRMGKRLAVKFIGVETPEAVARYRNGYLKVAWEAVPELPEDTFYIFEVIGMSVVTESGEALGRVTDVLTNPGQDVYVVDRNGVELLLPAVKDVLRVDREAGKIIVQELEGLY